MTGVTGTIGSLRIIGMIGGTGTLGGIGVTGRTRSRGMNCPIATPSTKGRSASCGVSAPGAPATTAPRKTLYLPVRLRTCRNPSGKGSAGTRPGAAARVHGINIGAATGYRQLLLVLCHFCHNVRTGLKAMISVIVGHRWYHPLRFWKHTQMNHQGRLSAIHVRSRAHGRPHASRRERVSWTLWLRQRCMENGCLHRTCQVPRDRGHVA